MHVIDAEYQFDRHKLTFFFEADRRIDFRELVRDLFSVYKVSRERFQQQQQQQQQSNTPTPTPTPHYNTIIRLFSPTAFTLPLLTSALSHHQTRIWLQQLDGGNASASPAGSP